MVQYEFASMAFPNQRTMLDAIASSWLYGDGLNDRADVARFLRDTTDAGLAADCWKNFGLDEAPYEPDMISEEAQSHAAFNNYTVDDLARAFARFREAFNNEMTFRFVNSAGHDVTDTEEVEGYNIHDFFSCDPTTATADELAAAYLGPDCDGIRVKWVAE